MNPNKKHPSSQETSIETTIETTSPRLETDNIEEISTLIKLENVIDEDV